MDDQGTSDPKPSATGTTSLLPHELGFVGLDWFEHLLGTWFELGRAHSAQAVIATRDLANAASAMMGSVAALSLPTPVRSSEPASPSSDP